MLVHFSVDVKNFIVVLLNKETNPLPENIDMEWNYLGIVDDIVPYNSSTNEFPV